MGKRVSLHGLKGAAELNGQEGVVTGPMDMDTQRYDVQLDPKSAEEQPRIVKVKAANLQASSESGGSKVKASLEGQQTIFEGQQSGVFVEGQRVSIRDLKAKAELNGQVGEAQSFDEIKERYTVKNREHRTSSCSKGS